MKSSASRSLPHLFARDGTLHPARDWFLMLGLVAVLIGIGIGFSVLTFIRVEAGETLGEPQPGTPAIDPASIDSVKALFSARADEAARYRDAYRFADPSR